MLNGKTLGVVVPAYNEEGLIARRSPASPASSTGSSSSTTPRATRPRERAAETGDPRVEVIVHERNRGVGAAIVTGYKRALELELDVTVVMAGDNQMDPKELDPIARPVLLGEVDYAKANRLITGRAWELIPHNRYLGNAVLSLLTKIASGLLARRRLAGRLRRDLARDARAARPRPRLHALRLPERPARAPERHQRAGPRHPVAADLQRRRALRDPHPQGRAAHLVAAPEGLLLADEGEVRHPRLPPARLLLRARDRDDPPRPRARDRRGRCCASAATRSRRRRSCSSRCSSSRAPSSPCSPCGSTWSRTRTCADRSAREAASRPARTTAVPSAVPSPGAPGSRPRPPDGCARPALATAKQPFPAAHRHPAADRTTAGQRAPRCQHRASSADPRGRPTWGRGPGPPDAASRCRAR